MQFSSQRREVFVLVHRNEIPILLTVETDDLLLPVVTSLPFTGHAIQPPPLPHVQHVHRHSYRHSDGGARREEELDARDVPPPARPVYPRHRQREQREANVLQRRDDPESRPREPAGDGERHGRPQDRSVEGVRHALPDHGQYRGNGRQGHCQVDDEEERRRRRGDLRPLPHPVDEVAQRRARQRRDQVGDRHDPPGLLCRGVLFCAASRKDRRSRRRRGSTTGRCRNPPPTRRSFRLPCRIWRGPPTKGAPAPDQAPRRRRPRLRPTPGLNRTRGSPPSTLRATPACTPRGRP
mmetsp:Transcript_38284/g.91666  ORF Transcript_38284/g.91666 Transcript_38284/m.91666 type:complete len:294 (-) Transcript_38284:830-1711(-)